MSNLFQKLGVGVSDFGKWLATAVKDTVSIASRIEKILKAEQPLAKPFVSSLSTIVADVEALIGSSESALSAKGLNFSADSQTYQQFVTLIADFKSLRLSSRKRSASSRTRHLRLISSANTARPEPQQSGHLLKTPGNATE
jgi:hypothetical protein